MFTAALTGLFASLAGLAVLFGVKYVEVRRQVMYAPRMRMRADQWARVMKAVLRFLVMRIEQLPQDFVVFLRLLVHIGAIVFARAARAAERGAHNVADRVSHKHQFERGESQSAFLKSVSDHKNGLEKRP